MAGKFVMVGEQFPVFRKKALVSLTPGKEFREMSNRDIEGKWTVFFWWPKDFSLICPTEVKEFNKNYTAFTNRNTMLIGASTDSELTHKAWRKHDAALNEVSFPMIADTSKSLAEELGILGGEEKVAYRTTYIIDPEGLVRWINIGDMSVGRNVSEVLRTLDALQTGALCPCNWNKETPTLTATAEEDMRGK